MIEIYVRGLPISQGSGRAFMAGGKAYIATGAHDSRSPLAAWRSSIASEARLVMGDRPALDGPVAVEIRFWLPRPAAHYHTPLHGAGIRDTAPIFHAKKPDIDKLLRAALDAIAAVVIRDDAQVASLGARKLYEDPVSDPVGAWITVRPLARDRSLGRVV
jgi:Holliday junction resolvase RusA-like endonuclease